MSVHDQRAWVNFRRMRTALAWMATCPSDVTEVKLWWNDTDWTKVTRPEPLRAPLEMPNL